MQTFSFFKNKKIPDSIVQCGQFELTPYCNLDCKMCYIHECTEAGRVILPASFWIDKAKQAVKEGMLVLSLTGGETLLYPELDILMEELRKMGLLISFNTNGTLIDERRVEWFLKHFPNKINISLYGATNETYQKMCGIKDGFTRVSKAIDLLMDAGLLVYLNGMITPYNIDELSLMHEFAAKRGLVLHLSPYVFPLRSQPGKDTRGEHRLSAEEAARATANNQVILYGQEQYKQLGARSLMEIDFRRKGIIKDKCSECNGGVCNFQISHDGRLHTCAMFQGVSVSLGELSFSEGWKQLKQRMKETPFPSKCNDCDKKGICPICKGAIYLETGTTTEVPEYLCKYSEAYERILRKECGNVPVSLQNSRNLNHSYCSE